MKKRPIVLCIMDGYGISESINGNAVRLANTPNLDDLMAMYPNTTISASGMPVGLPDGQMGNSEVGHLNIGAGRTVYQSLTLINKALNEKTFFENEKFLKVIQHAKDNGSKLHIWGLLSNGGVHSSNEHIYGLLELAKQQGLDKVYVHAFLDGRDVAPDSGVDFVKELQEKIEKMKNEKEDAVINQKFEKAAELRDKEKSLKEQFEKEQKKWNNKKTKDIVTITEENIAEVISSWTGIPAKKITEDENEKLKNLEVELHKRVIGQNEAVEAVSKAIRRGRVGLKDPKRPIGSFLFLGPTGVGKTELSKALAEVLFGDENAMIRLDMSEFMEPHSVSKLIGAPPGYVGFDDGGQLTEKIRRKPYSVVLFDEIEKAHPDVMNMLLQILEDGRLTDSQGRTVNFKNTVIIMTSNLGARLITDRKQLGFANKEGEADSKKEYEEIKKEVMAELKKELRPEFINRIDEIIVFHKLNDNDINQIIDIMLKEVVNRLKEQKYDVKFEPDVKEMIAKEGIDKNFGARPLRRTIQNLVEDKLAEEILDGKLVKGKVNKITKRQLGQS